MCFLLQDDVLMPAADQHMQQFCDDGQRGDQEHDWTAEHWHCGGYMCSPRVRQTQRSG